MMQKKTREKGKRGLSGSYREKIEKFKRDFSVKFSGITQRLAPILDAIAAMPFPRKVLIVILVLTGVLWACYFFSSQPKMEKLVRMERDLEAVDARIFRAQKALAGLDPLKEKKAAMDSLLDEAMRALPESHEIPKLLADISATGRSAGVEFLSFKPEKEIARDFYAEIPVSVEMKGDFHQTVLFLDALARMPRLVNVRDIHIQSQKNSENTASELRTRCKVVTYRFVEQDAGSKK